MSNVFLISWNDISEKAKDCRFGEEALKVKDNAKADIIEDLKKNQMYSAEAEFDENIMEFLLQFLYKNPLNAKAFDFNGHLVGTFCQKAS